MTDIGIVCPECGGNLSSNYKRRKGCNVRRCYRCQNPQCPARQSGCEVIVHTTETVWITRRQVIKSIGRMQRKKVPDIRQKNLDFAVGDFNIDAARE